MTLIALILAFQFYRFTVVPVKKTLIGIQEASDRGDFETILKSLPYTELFDITRQLSNKTSELMQAKHKSKLGDVATQIAHDIESPLAALMSVAQHSEKLPKDQRELINSAASRIHNLADELLKQYRNENSSSEKAHTFVCSVVRSVLAEKNVQLESYPRINLESKILCPVGSRLVKVPQSDLARILSNLINNSIQALPKEGGYIKIIVDSLAAPPEQILEEDQSGQEQSEGQEDQPHLRGRLFLVDLSLKASDGISDQRQHESLRPEDRDARDVRQKAPEEAHPLTGDRAEAHREIDGRQEHEVGHDARNRKDVGNEHVEDEPRQQRERPEPRRLVHLPPRRSSSDSIF
jgi:hypothetical protein